MKIKFQSWHSSVKTTDDQAPNSTELLSVSSPNSWFFASTLIGIMFNFVNSTQLYILHRWWDIQLLCVTNECFFSSRTHSLSFTQSPIALIFVFIRLGPQIKCKWERIIGYGSSLEKVSRIHKVSWNQIVAAFQCPVYKLWFP